MDSLTAEYRHTPVMLDEVLCALKPQPGEVVCDCTLGGAGHSVEMAKRVGADGLIVGVDQDGLARSSAEARLASEAPNTPRKVLAGNFSELDRLLVEAELPGVDCFLFDLGVSSPQLDIPQRGFSYREDAPLDMRMNPGIHTQTAAELIQHTNETELARIIRLYGEERHAARIAREICRRREQAPIETTFQLVDAIKAAIPAASRRAGGHPAKKTFQALRIEVNQELEVLKRGLEAAIRWAEPGGRICVISYHSLEDRIVKQIFGEHAQGCTCPPGLPVCACGNVPILDVTTRRPWQPTDAEVERNPRARSAKLRCAQKR